MMDLVCVGKGMIGVLSLPKFADDEAKGRIILFMKRIRYIGINREIGRIKAMKLGHIRNNTYIVAAHIIDWKD